MSKKDKKEKKPFSERIRRKFRLSIYKDENIEQVFCLRMTLFNYIMVLTFSTLIFIFLIIAIIIYTPVKHLIPGFPNATTAENIRLNNIKLDSLEMEISKRDMYFINIRKILSGETPENFQNSTDTEKINENLNYISSKNDVYIDETQEQPEDFNLIYKDESYNESSLSKVLFFPPVKGIITNKYNAGSDHYGVDIVAEPSEIVKSTLSGTVVMKSWTLETGNVLIIQHDNNIISVYKHNAECFKVQGDYVRAGDPIAIIGNSGELTTGPHLHFELWYNGNPINPLNYISFK